MKTVRCETVAERQFQILLIGAKFVILIQPLLPHISLKFLNFLFCMPLKPFRGDSGLVLMAAEQSRVLSYYVPSLGPAPRWCSFLDVLTEELEEEGEASVYEDYKFVTAAEVGPRHHNASIFLLPHAYEFFQCTGYVDV